MNKYLKALFELGIKDWQSEYLQRKIRISNQLGIITILAVALPFALISIMFFQELTWIPVIGILVLSLVMVLNRFGAIYASRMTLSVVPLLLATLYHAYLLQPGEPPLGGLLVISMGFALFPFVVFDIRERNYLIICGVVVLTCILGFKQLNDIFYLTGLDNTIIRTGGLYEISLFLGLIISLSNVTILSYLNTQAERKAANLLREINEQNDSLQAKQQEMTQNMQKLEEAQEEERKRNWASEGLARFSTLTREHDNLSELGDALVKTLSQYMNANQAGFYVVNEEGNDKYIELIACYAYDRKKFEEKRIEVGQGLIGQSYLENEYIHLTEIPQDYINITSGLGDAPPDNLIIVPLKANEQAVGFFEVASFHPFKEYQIEWLHDLGENIAATIRNSRVNEQTRKLLEDSRTQAEMLKSQEEEMRQNMEELAATQEEVTRKERDYIKRIEELEEQLNAQSAS